MRISAYVKGILTGIFVYHTIAVTIAAKAQKEELDKYHERSLGYGPNDSYTKYYNKNCPKGKPVPKTKPKNPIGFC